MPSSVYELDRPNGIVSSFTYSDEFYLVRVDYVGYLILQSVCQDFHRYLYVCVQWGYGELTLWGSGVLAFLLYYRYMCQ